MPDYTKIDFAERFATYSSKDLLKIIDRPNDYQPLAVETARTILNSRQLNEQEIKAARAELATQRQIEQEKKQRITDVENKAKDILISLLAFITPIQTETPTTEKWINIISGVFCGLFLFQLYNELDLIRFMIADSESKWESGIFLYFFPLVILPIALFLFFKRKRAGWLLFSTYLIYSATSSLELLIRAMSVTSPDVPIFDGIFPKALPSMHLLTLAFFVGALWTICRKQIRGVYTIDGAYVLRTIIIVATLTVLMTRMILV